MQTLGTELMEPMDIFNKHIPIARQGSKAEDSPRQADKSKG